MNPTNNKIKRTHGFAIVEILVIIGVIAIIAIVYYSATFQKTKEDEANKIDYISRKAKEDNLHTLTNAQNVQNVAELFASEFNYYPMSTKDFENSNITKLPAGIYFYISGKTGDNSMPNKSNGTDTIDYEYCGATDYPLIDKSATGGRIRFWDFKANKLSETILYVGMGSNNFNQNCKTWITLKS